MSDRLMNKHLSDRTDEHGVAVINSLGSGRRHNSKPSTKDGPPALSPEIRAAIEATVKRLYVDANVEAFSIEEFCLRYGVGRQLAYDEIKAGRLVAVKAGGSRRTLIRRVAAERWIETSPTIKPASGEAA